MARDRPKMATMRRPPPAGEPLFGAGRWTLHELQQLICDKLEGNVARSSKLYLDSYKALRAPGGRISPLVFKKQLDKWGIQLSQNEAEVIFKTIDADGSGLISLDELIKFMLPGDLDISHAERIRESYRVKSSYLESVGKRDTNLASCTDAPHGWGIVIPPPQEAGKFGVMPFERTGLVVGGPSSDRKKTKAQRAQELAAERTFLGDAFGSIGSDGKRSGSWDVAASSSLGVPLPEKSKYNSRVPVADSQDNRGTYAWNLDLVQLKLVENMQAKVRRAATQCRDAFKLFGLTKRGVGIKEFSRLLANLNMELPPERAQELFDRYDTDGRGIISFQKFVERVIPNDFAFNPVQSFAHAPYSLAKHRPEIPRATTPTFSAPVRAGASVPVFAPGSTVDRIFSDNPAAATSLASSVSGAGGGGSGASASAAETAAQAKAARPNPAFFAAFWSVDINREAQEDASKADRIQKRINKNSTALSKARAMMAGFRDGEREARADAAAAKAARMRELLTPAPAPAVPAAAAPSSEALQPSTSATATMQRAQTADAGGAAARRLQHKLSWCGGGSSHSHSLAALAAASAGADAAAAAGASRPPQRHHISRSASASALPLPLPLPLPDRRGLDGRPQDEAAHQHQGSNNNNSSGAGRGLPAAAGAGRARCVSAGVYLSAPAAGGGGAGAAPGSGGSGGTVRASLGGGGGGGGGADGSLDARVLGTRPSHTLSGAFALPGSRATVLSVGSLRALSSPRAGDGPGQKTRFPGRASGAGGGGPASSEEGGAAAAAVRSPVVAVASPGLSKELSVNSRQLLGVRPILAPGAKSGSIK